MALVGDIYDLDVFKLAYNLSLEIHFLSKKFDRTEQFNGIADQIRRASKSVCANLVEGIGKQTSIAEFKRFMSMAQGSAKETRLWLKYAFDTGELPDEAVYLRLTQDYLRVLQMLAKFRQSRDA